MGLTERHLFEFDDMPENSEWTLEDDLYNSVANHEPIPVGEKITVVDDVLDFYKCGYCGNAIRKPWIYCPFCGKAVKWK